MALRSFGDGAVFAEVFGDEPPKLLALHGWGRRGSDFKASFGDLSALAVDLPGFGASPAPTGVIGAEGYADIVAPLLDRCDGPPVLIGHSFGGRVAVCLAARFPEKVGSLVLTGVPLLRRERAAKPAFAYRMIRSLNRIGIVSDDRLEAEKQKRGSADYKAASGVMRDILVTVVNEEYPEQLSRITQHVTMLWGADDSEVPVSIAEKANDLINAGVGESTLEVLPGVGHHVPLKAPADLRRVTLELL